MLEEFIEKLKPIVIELFKNDSSGHDIGHLERVMRLALQIQETEGGDRLIIGISAFLHDVHRIMQNQTGKFVQPKDSINEIKRILSNIDITEEQVNKICYCIEHHEEYNWNKSNVTDLNTLILQDADNLDAIGAIGIGRTFVYMAVHNMPMYNDEIPFNNTERFIEDKVIVEPSTIHYIYSKLLKLGSNMNTATAKRMAQERSEFVKSFVEEFLNEWKGLK